MLPGIFLLLPAHFLILLRKWEAAMLFCMLVSRGRRALPKPDGLCPF